MAERIKALFASLPIYQYLFKRVHDDRDNEFRLYVPNTLNANVARLSLSIVARVALELLNLGITTAEKLMKFKMQLRGTRCAPPGAMPKRVALFETYEVRVCRNIDST